MAINQNVENVKFLRNGSLFATHEAALTGIQNEFSSGITSNTADGTAILARYGSGNDVKTLVGFIYINGENKSLTILDVDGAHADVEALRQEINAKLGDGVGSGESETVTAQLEQLSGDTASTSADTSVEGAKRYADAKVSEAIDGLEYTGVTTGDGKVIVNVTEADGIVSGATAEVGGLKLTNYSKGSDSGAVANTDSINQAISKLENQVDAANDARAAAIDALDYEDEASAKTFVTKVDEANGVISTTKGTITSSGKTIVLTDNADGGVNFEANVDGTTIIIDENTGTMSVASSALVQYEGDEDTIHISEESQGVKTVSSYLTIQKVTTGLSAEVKEEYHLVGHSGTTIGDPVKIYKDSHIVSITYITDSGDTHYQNLEYQYIDASGNTQTTYVDISMLVLEAEFASGVTITDHVAHGVVDPTSENFLTVGADGFKLSGVQDAINTAVSNAVEGLDATVSNSGTSGHVGVEIVEEDGELTAVTVTENDIASQTKLDELSGKTVTAITSTNNSITATIDEAVGNKSYDIETDASKIKMTGFTAAESGFTSITSASTVTEAVKAIEGVFLDNEEVTAQALNDLNGRVDTVSGDVNTISGNVTTISGNVGTISGDVNTLKTSYISGVSVNGSATTVTDHVAGFNITSSSAATTASTSNAIVVQTDANGNITLGLNYIDCGTY